MGRGQAALISQQSVILYFDSPAIDSGWGRSSDPPATIMSACPLCIV